MFLGAWSEEKHEATGPAKQLNMRTFIAIPLPQEIKASLAKLQEKLKASGADVKWVEPANIHLTLKFLGERDEKKIEKIEQAIQDTAKDKTEFIARISSLGAFPKISSPRVIWVGIDQGDSETKLIAGELEGLIAKIGIPKEEREFSSHITIGRTKSSKNLEKLVKVLSDYTGEFGKDELKFTVKKIVLYKSTLTPRGPIYEALKDATLKTI